MNTINSIHFVHKEVPYEDSPIFVYSSKIIMIVVQGCKEKTVEKQHCILYITVTITVCIMSLDFYEGIYISNTINYRCIIYLVDRNMTTSPKKV